ncbi:MAG: bifunctional 5,10-methylenetetrahydrofolate dehydrogenase/5,10-methenyltetrahydrofolate cyclohydrolase [Armatimonadota bacterium]
MADIIDGQATAAAIKGEVQADVASLARPGVHPRSASLLVGDDDGAKMYRRQIERTAAEVGIAYQDVTLAAGAAMDDVLRSVNRLVRDPSVHGILLLRPLPAGLSETRVIDALDPAKDVDGLHPINAGRLAQGQSTLVPPTPWACFEMLERYFAGKGIDPRTGFEGKELVIVGRSNIVGKPAHALALQRNATTTTVHSFTWKAGRLAAHTRRADILIVAMGRAEFITAEMVRPGAIVVDVGIHSMPLVDRAGQPVLDERGRPRRKTVGDVAFDAVKDVAGAITPVPGGVGAVTNLLLMKNVVRVAHAR